MAKRLTTISHHNKILDLETRRSTNQISISIKVEKDQKYSCWWCRLPIETEILGCPLSLENEIYYTDGIYCSPNCIKAYILEYLQDDSRYRDSLRLLSIMVADVLGYKSTHINPSLPWRVLIQYGGHITPEKYKEMSKHITWVEKGIKVKPVVVVYEETEKY